MSRRTGTAKRSKDSSRAKAAPASARPEDTVAAAPCRVRLSRAKGFRLPPNTVKVDRSTRWGNPFTLLGGRTVRNTYRPYGVSATRHAAAADAAVQRQLVYPVERFRDMLISAGRWTLPPTRRFACLETTLDDVKRELAGKNLACWCAPGTPCHADVLLELANGLPTPPYLVRNDRPSPAMDAALTELRGMRMR